jgi:hypothetical protein
MKTIEGGGGMAEVRVGRRRRTMALALVVLGASLATGVHPADAEVTGVKGSAFGYAARNITIFNGAQPDTGPAPVVTLASDASNSPQSANVASGLVKYGPAFLFTSGAITVNTSGKTGAGGTVTSSTDIQNVNTSGQEVLTAASLSSTCSASTSATSGSTTVSGGKLTTSEGSNLDSDADDTVVQIPDNPAPNTSYQGTIETVGDTFRYVFNEQVRNPDGSITVNAAHQYLLGPTAVGEVILGQSRCGSTTVAAAGGGTQTVASTGGGGGLASTGAAIAVFVAMALLLVVGGSTTTWWVGGVTWRERVSRRMPWAGRGLLR